MYRQGNTMSLVHTPPSKCYSTYIVGTIRRVLLQSPPQYHLTRSALLTTSTVASLHKTNHSLRRAYSYDRIRNCRRSEYHRCPIVDQIRRRQQHQQPQQPYTNRFFSSNQLLGHSPMSHNNSSNSIMNPGGTHMGLSIPDSKYIPTAYEAVIGNVWQTSTWRRDKLLELKGELNTLPEVIANHKDEKVTLDFLATDRQKLDLYLVDGMHLIIQHVEESIPSQLSTTETDTKSNVLSDIVQRMEQAIAAETGASMSGGSSSKDHLLTESEWNRILLSLQKDIETILSTTTRIQPAHIYPPIRDYMNLDEQNEQHKKLLDNEDFLTFVKEQKETSKQPTPCFETPNDNTTKSSQILHSLQYPHVESFHNSVTRYQLLLTLAMVQQLQQSWKTFTTMTDQDIDRAAATLSTTDTTTTGSTPSSTSPLIPVKKLIQIIEAYLIPNRNDSNESTTSVNDRRINALWALIDKDNDGMIDQVEMNQICTIAVTATQNSLRQLVQEVIDVVPMDHFSPSLRNDDTTTTPAKTKKIGWRKRRRIRNDKTAFVKRLNYVLQNHYDNELEMSHRLRCIYSWSNKQHQNNRIDSILVQEENNGIVTNVVGRKRFVELYPKIAIQEFREVQRIHFPQLDRIGQEYMKSLREEFWIVQGQGRQNRELQRDCTLFLVGVCILDYIVLAL